MIFIKKERPINSPLKGIIYDSGLTYITINPSTKLLTALGSPIYVGSYHSLEEFLTKNPRNSKPIYEGDEVTIIH